MTLGHNFWDFEVWSFVLTLGILFVAMLLANLLRRVVPFLRKSLIPTPVLAGFLVLIANSIYTSIAGQSMFSGVTLEAITYHGLGLGFIAVSMQISNKPKTKQAQTDILNTGLSTVSAYLLQGILGLGITLTLSYVIANVFPSSGLLLPMGYGQGPGQAYNWGKNYQDMYSFTNGTSFGLTIAAMGFISAAIGGVIYLVKLKKSGKYIINDLGEGVRATPTEQVSDPDEFPETESMDKMSVQFGLVILAYLIDYGIMYGLYQIFLATGIDFLLNTVNPLIWGFNFLFGVVVAILIKNILVKLYNKKIVKRKYINNYMLTRISGVMFDLMVVASIAAIDLSAFGKVEFLVPLIAISVVGMVATYFQMDIICKKLFPDYEAEQFLAMFGMNTGTASTGVVLLREIDPHLDTPASKNIVFQSLYAILFGFPMLLLLGFAPRTELVLFGVDFGTKGWAWLSLIIMVVLFAIMTVILFRKFIFKGKKAKIDNAQSQKID